MVRDNSDNPSSKPLPSKHQLAHLVTSRYITLKNCFVVVGQNLYDQMWSNVLQERVAMEKTLFWFTIPPKHGNTTWNFRMKDLTFTCSSKSDIFENISSWATKCSSWVINHHIGAAFIHQYSMQHCWSFWLLIRDWLSLAKQPSSWSSPALRCISSSWFAFCSKMIKSHHSIHDCKNPQSISQRWISMYIPYIHE